MHHPDTDDKRLAEIVVLKKRQLGEDVGSVRRLVWMGEYYADFDWRNSSRSRATDHDCQRPSSLTTTVQDGMAAEMSAVHDGLHRSSQAESLGHASLHTIG